MQVQGSGKKTLRGLIPVVTLTLFSLLSVASAAGVYIKHISLPDYIGRELTEPEMKEVGQLICDAVTDFQGKRREIVERVDALCKRFPIYEN